MVRHMLLWNCSPSVHDRSLFLDTLRQKIGEVQASCPGFLRFQLDLALPGSTHDIGFYCEFADRAALDAYQFSPKHLAFKAQTGDLLTDRACADLEVL